ncbi:MAG TPA: serine/threonine-protein kinase, partial [Anaerolineales bacterium]|nr:serine/threonine-protein kinase [Anaerolineales bacterium]
MANDMIGKTFGSYKLVGQLGQGGMASVYRGYQEAIDRSVAIKIMPAELLHDPNFIKRFINEARTLAKLSHPNILPLYDFGEANGAPYIIMPLMAGGTLVDRIRRGPMSPAEVVRILVPIADALDYAHSQGLLHRDIKPNNILFDARDHPVLADFGIAKYLESASNLTGTGIIGTPDYMSPEQARGEQLDRRADVYSLAVVAYQMFTG